MTNASPQSLADTLIASGIPVRHVRDDLIILERPTYTMVEPMPDGSFLVCWPPQTDPPPGTDPSKYVAQCYNIPHLIALLIRKQGSA